MASIEPFTDAVPAGDARIIAYPGEVGTCLQHLAILVGRQAQARVWPEIIAWLKAGDPSDEGYQMRIESGATPSTDRGRREEAGDRTWAVGATKSWHPIMRENGGFRRA